MGNRIWKGTRLKSESGGGYSCVTAPRSVPPFRFFFFSTDAGRHLQDDGGIGRSGGGPMEDRRTSGRDYQEPWELEVFEMV